MSGSTEAVDLKNQFVNEYGTSVAELADALDWEGIARSNDQSDGDLKDELLNIPGDVNDFNEEVLNIVTWY